MEWCTRFVPALLAAAGVLLIHSLGRRLFGKTIGWAAGLVWIGTYFPYEQTRLASADAFLAFFTLLCVWAWVRAAPPTSHAQAQSRRDLRGFDTVVFYASLALLESSPRDRSFCCMSASPSHCFTSVSDVGHPAAHRRPAGRDVCLLIAAPWFLYVYLHVPDALTIWRYEIRSASSRPTPRTSERGGFMRQQQSKSPCRGQPPGGSG